jgi:hypothetical protein
LSKHSQARAGYGPLPQVSALVVGAVVGAVTWVFLVLAAIDFGEAALSGRPLAWVFLLPPAAGAVACFVLVLALGYRMLYLLGLVSEYKPRRSSGRRAAR